MSEPAEPTCETEEFAYSADELPLPEQPEMLMRNVVIHNAERIFFILFSSVSFRKKVTGGRAARLLSLSVVEKSDSRECHCDAVLVAGVDNIIVTDRTAGLSYVFYTASVRSFNVVAEGEECV